MKILHKLVLLSIASSLAIVSVIVLTTWVESESIKTEAKTEIEKLVDSQLQVLSSSAYNLAHQIDVQLDERLHSNIENFKQLIQRFGGISISGSLANIKAVNQFTKQESVITVPGLTVGGKQIPFAKEKSTPVLLVDEISKKYKVAATIFVRMNGKGDMLRIATSVLTKDGNRAVGTYIPRTMPDGNANKVVSTILQGNDYTGSAYVVDKWYQTKYSPIKDGNGKVIGMIFVGISLDDVDGLKKAFYDMKFGETGYVFVIIGSGDRKGEYFISLNGKRDGENIWEAKDAEGKFVIQDIIKIAKETPTGTTSRYTYFWQNKGEESPREKIALVQYFKDFDWVLGTTAYFDEMYQTSVIVQSGITEILIYTIIFGLIIAVFAVLVSIFFANKIGKSVTKVTKVANLISSGNLNGALAEIETEK